MKTLKVNVPAFDLEAIAKVLTELDVPEGVIPELSSTTGLPNKSLRKLFEEVYKNSKMDFTHAESGNYSDMRIESIYLSFKYALIQHRRAIHDAKKRIRRDTVQSPFIIGMQVDDNTVQFGYRPYKHNTLVKAQKEADKLRERNGKSYTIFAAVGHSLVRDKGSVKLNTPVEETRQGPKGKLVRSPFKVMDEWKKIIQENDIASVSIPVSIGFTAGGRHCVNYSMSQGSHHFDEYSQCIEFVDRWIRDYRLKHPEQMSCDDAEVNNVS